MEIVKYFAIAVGLFISLAFVVLVLIYAERKSLARIQQRLGPTRVGFRGILQPVADALKLISKEDVLPSWADRGVYWVAPIVVFVPAFMVWATIPIAEDLVVSNLDLGLFYIVAISVLSVMGLVMAGWGSANKWAMMGGLRAAGQLVSYEIPFIMSILTVAVLAQTLNLEQIVSGQSMVAYILIQPMAFFIFLTSGLAELGRTPFDIHHAESEVVGGPFVEYSGAHWSVFYLAEYLNTFTVAVLAVILFLGGWMWPTMPFTGSLHTVLSVILFVFKTACVIWLIFWIRGTYPRIRIDQLMAFGWKLLIPMSFVNMMVTSAVLFYGLHLSVLSIISIAFLLFTFWAIKKNSGTKMKRNTVQVLSSKDLRRGKTAKLINTDTV
jgi:NADH-quinone oxidoreductase subunit H